MRAVGEKVTSAIIKQYIRYQDREQSTKQGKLL
ncbi:MAG: hypothetical protein COT32_01315 [Candidatus Nealsonbacteria bacterium CG08_land_8_20_14_0_20_36_22]|uniref:Uncharacterized protein n=1 Tax=Candidatus Nealsonbacteria bacterium CG08_land_8_20_14_0_20_36_22 TaxID=1974704 RepID=A0A2H0YQX1_9BACT|nr:MAG: hypothetical protein COT32_01315 [Candidatus Nealsonbacteria bacterium CG08_land_8_20_14_0_20_36_22]